MRRWSKVLFDPARSSTIRKLRKAMRAGYPGPKDRIDPKYLHSSRTKRG